MFPLKTIVNARDFSEPSAEAHHTACDMARRYEAKLIFIHVTDKPVVSYFEEATELPPDELQKKLFESLRLPSEDERGLKVEHRVVEGTPVQQILRVAKDESCDLIVLGTHGKRGMSRWFTSSVAEDVIRKAECSVLISKAPRSESPSSSSASASSAQQLSSQQLP